MSATTPASPPARWWHAIEGKKVVCRLCPRECHIPVGSRGFCFVRANVDGHLELTTYGRSSGFCIDPVEKKPLNHFLPGTPILSFGTAGCNLGCKFCQNWDISKSREIDKVAHVAGPEAIVEAALRHGCRSLAFTYNDPVIWAEYALDIAKVARARGLKTVAVTAGYISREARGEFYEHMDAANVDLKAFTDSFYDRLCQVKLAPVLDTLKFLKHETNVWFELTNLMIPGENDSTDETKAMCAWIVENLGPDVPVHFTAFHPDFKMRDKPPTPPETLVRARRIAMDAGIRYAFVGNVNDVENQSTYCHGCGKMVIQRDWYELGAYHLKGNACVFCGTVIPGVFDTAGPGTWGRKREPISIGDDAGHFVRLTSSMTTNESSGTVKAMGGLNVVPAGTVAPAVGVIPGGELERTSGTVAPRVDFTAQEDEQILNYARGVVESAVRNELFPSVRLPEGLAQSPAYGLFVSLHRGMQLRSCKGQFGGDPSGGLAPLSHLLNKAARDAALHDPRFPRITHEEFPFLTVEVSLMHSPQVIAAIGEERVRSVHVGTHGLVITHPNGAGLLLPHVATEAGWDSRTFLEQTCHKAGLPAHAWRDPEARLLTFCARKISSGPPVAELDLAEVGANGLTQLLVYIHQLLGGHADIPGNPGIPSQAQAPLLHHVHPEELGLCLQTPSGVAGTAIAPNNSLLGLAKMAAQSLANAWGQRGPIEPVRKMTLLWQPVGLVAGDYPARHQTLGHCAVVAQVDGRWSLSVPQEDGRMDTVAQALSGLKITHQQWLEERTSRVRVRAFNALQCNNQPAGLPAPVPGAVAPGGAGKGGLRTPFHAGSFYPADTAQAAAEMDGYLRAGGLGQAPVRPYRAIMLPHAGWRYCGGTMGKTLAGIKLPETIIIIGPKHTALGPPRSVANHAAWQIPGATIPVAVSIVERLSRAIPPLQCEPETHRQEHAIEVLLPFLHRLRPDLQIVPILLGSCDFETISAIARELAAILNNARAAGQEEPLLVISSDMNHFAAEAENRRRDTLALQAMQSGDPRRLYETCISNDISMCGLLPAVTVMHTLQQRTPAIHPQLVDYTTSAAASGDASRVVGYAGMVIE